MLHGEIKAIEYSPFSGFQTINQGAIELSSYLLYSKSSDKNCNGGMLDLRLGNNQREDCKICKQNAKKCTGHFGFLKLFLPIINLGYVKTLGLILECICKSCSKLLFSNEIEKNQIIFLFRKLKSTRKIKQHVNASILLNKCRNPKICLYCGALNGQIRKYSIWNFEHKIGITNNVLNRSGEKKNRKNKFFGGKKAQINPLEIFEILRKIPEEDLEMLNIDPTLVRPEDFISTIIPVPPLPMRPSVQIGKLSSNEDELTIKLCEIQKINLKIGQIINQSISWDNLNVYWNLLQIECSRYFNSEIGTSGIFQVSEKGLFQRLKGKSGRFRGTLSGKRVDFSGRTVISPDPFVRLNFVGVPIKMASNFTVPERINFLNQERILRYIIRGSDIYPGALTIVNSSGRKKLPSRINSFDINISSSNCTVERHLVENDLILLNRQPSLHKVSILCHRVKIVNTETFSINESVCKPYNADFDGDEMNIHIPQTLKARTEAAVIMNIVKNLNSPRNGEINISCIQDFLSCIHILTSKNTFFFHKPTPKMFYYENTLFTNNYTDFPAIIKPEILWTGKQVFSNLISSISVSHRKKTKSVNEERFLSLNSFFCLEKYHSLKERTCAPFMCEKEGFLIFKNNNLICGQLGKNSFGSGSIISFLCLSQSKVSNNFTSNIILNIGKFTSEWFSNYGLSIGHSDLSSNRNLILMNTKFTNDLKSLAFFSKVNPENSKTDFSQKKFFGKSGSLFTRFRSLMLEAILNEKTNQNNPIYYMVNSGAKGNTLNLCQMIYSLGFQKTRKTSQEVRRCRRNLPYQKLRKNKIELFDSLILNNFTNGLTNIDLFFHSSAGREGLIDTAIKTSETGYLQRKLFKALESLICLQDGSVRSTRGRLIQMKYGDDCLDPEKLGKAANSFYSCQFLKNIAPNNTKFVFSKYETETFRRSHEIIPFRVSPIKTNQFTSFSKDRRDLDSSPFKTELSVALSLECLKEAFLEPCSSIGGVSAQSIGEPGTQMTLQTFHQAGIGNSGITMGIPRLNEIINSATTKNSEKTTVEILSFKRKFELSFYLKRMDLIFLGEICTEISWVLDLRISILRFYFPNQINQIIPISEIKYLLKKYLLDILKIEGRFHISRGKGVYYLTWSVSGLTRSTNFGYKSLIRLIQLSKTNLPSLSIVGFFKIVKLSIKKPWDSIVLTTDYSDILTIMTFSMIRPNTIITNHVLIIQETLGIEAARLMIKREISEVFGSYKISIDSRHISLIADLMTNLGTICPINRFGLEKTIENTLVLASFEKTLDILFNSSSKSMIDKNFGVSESIVIGKKCPIGTGLCTAFFS